MHRIVHTAEFTAPPAQVFDFVTNPAQWHRWHPATHAVRGVEDRPLQRGETVIERIKAAHREFDAEWTVVACDPPALWQLETSTPLGASVLTYRLRPTASGGTHFERTCDFRSHGFWRLLDGNVTKWMLATQAKKALENLRPLVAVR
jgi:uncharacterized protein YndB with AHSA1/START domain